MSILDSVEGKTVYYSIMLINQPHYKINECMKDETKINILRALIHEHCIYSNN